MQKRLLPTTKNTIHKHRRTSDQKANYSRATVTTTTTITQNLIFNLMFVDLNTILRFIKKIQQDAKIYQIVYYSIFIWSSTCFERHTAHHQEPKTALAASGFSYLEGCWTCSWWTLPGTLCLATSTNYTSSNLPRMKNQRLPVQF